MTGPRTFVVVGAGLAAASAASSLRAEGFDGRLVVVGDESDPPYERPPLSKEYLRGESAFDAAVVHPAAWYEENDVDLRLGVRVEAVDLATRSVTLPGGETLGYDALLLATGGRNRAVPFPGGDLHGVFQLRRREDAERIREAASGGARVAIVGAGFIGLEVAASLRSRGAEVEVVEVFERPLERVLGPEVGAVFEAIHRDHGVVFHMNEHVERLEGGERVERLVTSEGTTVACDVAVVGIGIQPNVELADAAGLDVDNGVLVDERLAASAPGVFAAGDVANHAHPVFGRRIRVEHYDNAIKQGVGAARAMLGETEPFADPHWFWSDQYEHDLQYVGFADRWDEIVLRGSLQDRSFVAFYVRDGVVDGVGGLGRGREVRRARDLVRARSPVDPALLRDEDVDLKTLSRVEAAAGDGPRASRTQ